MLIKKIGLLSLFMIPSLTGSLLCHAQDQQNDPFYDFLNISQLKEKTLLSGVSTFGQTLGLLIEVDPALAKNKKQIEDQARQFLLREIRDTQSMDDDLVIYLKSSFSEQEIIYLNRFFNTKLGVKYLKQGQSLSEASIKSGAAWANIKMKKFRK